MFSGIAVQRAARQQPKEVRTASLSCVKQAVRERWKPTARANKHINDARKLVAARYLQLKLGHAITGAHLKRIGKAQDERCWWRGSSRHTVVHLMLDCRKWQRQPDTMLRSLNSNKITIRARRDQADSTTFFKDNTAERVLHFIEKHRGGQEAGG